MVARNHLPCSALAAPRTRRLGRRSRADLQVDANAVGFAHRVAARRAQSPGPSIGRLRGQSAQRGAAIISALFVVSLAAILVAGLLWRQQIQIRRIENQRLAAQAQWVSRGALDWTRLILRAEADTSPTITYLGGVWAVPIAKTRLSDFLGKFGDVSASQGDQTFLSGSIEDAQSKFNLRNLVTVPAPGQLQIDMEQTMAFQRLLQSLGLNGQQLARRTALQMRAALARSAVRFQTPNNPLNPQPQQLGGAVGGDSFTDKPGLADVPDNADQAPLQMTSVDSLLDVPGFTQEMVAKLRPFVTVLPTETPVNMNTASAEVIAAIVPGMTVSSAQALVSRRETVFFLNTGNVELALRGAGAPVGLTGTGSIPMDVTTSYFFVHGRVQHERAEVDRTTLIYRDPLTHSTRIVRASDRL